MTDPPRHLPPTSEERLRTVVSRMAGGSNAGSTRFARPVKTVATQPGGGNPLGAVIVGDTSVAEAAGSTAVAITSTVNDADVAAGAAQAGERGLALADNSIADGVASVAAGASAEALDDRGTAVGCQAKTTAPGGTAVGFDAWAFGSNNTSVGAAATTGTAGSPVTGATALGTGAAATRDNELALGNGSAIAIVKGKLVMADDVTGALYHVVLTSGVLSFVAYP